MCINCEVNNIVICYELTYHVFKNYNISSMSGQEKRMSLKSTWPVLTV